MTYATLLAWPASTVWQFGVVGKPARTLAETDHAGRLTVDRGALEWAAQHGVRSAARVLADMPA